MLFLQKGNCTTTTSLNTQCVVYRIFGIGVEIKQSINNPLRYFHEDLYAKHNTRAYAAAQFKMAQQH